MRIHSWVLGYNPGVCNLNLWLVTYLKKNKYNSRGGGEGHQTLTRDSMAFSGDSQSYSPTASSYKLHSENKLCAISRNQIEKTEQNYLFFRSQESYIFLGKKKNEL